VGRRELLGRYLRGPVTLSVGAAVLGLCSYVFLTVAARGLVPEQFGELSALWALLFGFVAGLWYPVEQETTRVVAVAEDGPAPAAAVVARISVLATIPALALVVVFLVSLGDRALGGVVGLGAALAVAVPAIGLASFQRGALLGRRRYGWAAWQLAADGIVRAVGVVVLAAVDAEVGWYGVLLAVAPLVAVALTAPGRVPLGGHDATASPSPPVPWRPVLADLARLLAGSYLAIVLFNVGPLIVRLGGTAEETGRFMAMFVIARLPLFFAGAVVSGLLATLVRTYEQGSPQAFLRASRSAAAAAAGVSLLACVPLGLLAPWAARTFFGSAYEVDLVQSVTVALSTAGFVTALVLQGALVAAREQRAVAWSWLLAAVAFVVAAVAPSVAGSPGIGTVVAVAYLVSSVVAVLAMLLALDRAVSPRAARRDSGRSRS
jgi:O-antigen/teichoic acid export membrane protein